jgi:hypothetical protein
VGEFEFRHTDSKPQLFRENRIRLQRKVFVTTSHVSVQEVFWERGEARPHMANAHFSLERSAQPWDLLLFLFLKNEEVPEDEEGRREEKRGGEVYISVGGVEGMSAW